MSSTNRGGQRNDADNYPTPAWCVRRLLEAAHLPGGRWLEPAAGEGAIIRAVNEVRDDVEWSAVEVRKDAAERLFTHEEPIDELFAEDFLTWTPPCCGPLGSLGFRHWNVIITNPPYSLAQPFVERSLELADGVAMLLRLNFLGSEKRADFMRANPPDVYVLPNRPSFTSGGTDSTEYAWFVWTPRIRKTHGGLSVLPSTPKQERASEVVRCARGEVAHG